MAFEHIPLDQTPISYTTGTARKNFTEWSLLSDTDTES